VFKHTYIHTSNQCYRIIGNLRLHVQVVPQLVSNIDLYEYRILIYMHTTIVSVDTIVMWDLVFFLSHLVPMSSYLCRKSMVPFYY
jgi:hypothetical protein